MRSHLTCLSMPTTFNKTTVFYTACACMFTFGMSVICLGSILPEVVEKFGQNARAAGVLTSLLPLGIMAGSLFCGPFADRYGYKLLFIICCLLVMAGMESIAFAADWWLIQVGVFLIGTGGGALNSSASSLTAEISEGERGAKLSTLGIFYGLGALGLPFIISLLSNQFTAFEIIGGLGGAILLVVLTVLLVRFPQAKQASGFPMAEAWKLVRHPVLLLMGMVMFFQSGLEGLVSNWSNGYLQNSLGVENRQALVGLTVHMASLTAMRVALGFLLKKYRSLTIMRLSYGLIVMGMFTFWLGGTFYTALLALALIGAGFAGIFPIFLGRAGDLFTHLAGTAFSIILVIALFGNTVINYAMGELSYRTGSGLLPGVLLILTGCMGFLLWRSQRHF